MNRLSALFPLLLVAACHQLESAPTSLVVRDSSGATIVEHPRGALAAAPALGLGDTLAVLGGSDPEFPDGLGFPREVVFGRQHELIVLDARDQRLLNYDSTGRFFRAVGRKGAGPQEFGGVMEIKWLMGDTLAASDLGNARVALLDPSLGFLRTELPGGTSARMMGLVHARASDGTFLTSVYDEKGSPKASGRSFREPSILVRVHPDGTQERVAPFFLGEDYASAPSGREDSRNSGPEYYEFGKESHVITWQNQAVIAEGNGWRFDVWDASGKLARRVILHEAARVVTQPMRDSAHVREKRRVTGSKNFDPNNAVMANWLKRVDRMQFADSLPPYQEFIAGHDGRLWVSEYLSPIDSVQHFAIFGTDGKLGGRLSVPVEWHLIAADDDRVLLWHRDSDGVVILHARRLVPATPPAR